MASIITAQLQSIMLAQCTSRLLLLPLDGMLSFQQPNMPSLQQELFKLENPSSQLIFLHLWVFNSAIKYTTTTKVEARSFVTPPDRPHSSSGKLAMKIFWKAVSGSAADKLMEDNTRPVEDVSLPLETILEIKKDLLDSAFLLPPSQRRFQDWDVGLLERFEEIK
jgi:HECT-like Ubiquitin-conjugating enzyme (E2)-binding